MACTTARICSRLSGRIPRYFSTQVLANRKIKVGDTLPDVVVFENAPSNPIKLRELFQGTKGILFSVLGAFNPGCSVAHIPEYINSYDQFKAEGYSVVACVSVNDPFVMAAWGKDVDSEGKLRMLADPKRELTTALNMELDCKHLLGNIRSKKYSMLIEDNRVKHMSMEPDHTGLACLLCIQRMQTTKKTDTQQLKNT